MEYSSILSFFLSMLIGMIISIPVGPQSLFCVKQALHYGAVTGIAAGIGISCADSVAAFCAGAGLSFFDTLPSNAGPYALLFSGCFLACSGFMALLWPKSGISKDLLITPSVIKTICTTFMLGISNPLLVFFIGGMLGAFGIALDATSVWIVSSGVGLGSLLWWILFIPALCYLRKYGGEAVDHWVRRGSALLLCVSGGGLLFRGCWLLLLGL